MKLTYNQRGDTLVEVLVSTVVLTIVLSGAYAISNRTTRINQTSIERTEVANQITEQAELIRAMRSQDDGTAGSNWQQIVTKANASRVTVPFDCSDDPSSDNAFYVRVAGASIGQPEDFNRPGALGSGTDAYPGANDLFDVWVVADSINNAPSSDLDDVIEFHVRGCWDGIGGESVQRSEVILRIRE